LYTIEKNITFSHQKIKMKKIPMVLFNSTLMENLNLINKRYCKKYFSDTLYIVWSGVITFLT